MLLKVNLFVLCVFMQTSISLQKVLCNSKVKDTLVLIVDKKKKHLQINKMSTYLCTYLVGPHLEVDRLFVHNYKVNQYIITWSRCNFEYLCFRSTWVHRFLLSQPNLIVNLQKQKEVESFLSPDRPECFDLGSDTICIAPLIPRCQCV